MYTLNWQSPYDWSWMLGFLAARAVSEWKRSRTVIMP